METQAKREYSLWHWTPRNERDAKVKRNKMWLRLGFHFTEKENQDEEGVLIGVCLVATCRHSYAQHKDNNCWIWFVFRGYFRSDDIRAEVTKKVFQTQLMTDSKQQRRLNQVAGKVAGQIRWTLTCLVVTLWNSTQGWVLGSQSQRRLCEDSNSGDGTLSDSRVRQQLMTGRHQWGSMP